MNYDYLSSDMPEKFALPILLHQKLRYGENPHQKASSYLIPSHAGKSGILQSQQLHGKELSYNNIVDADIALEIARDFYGDPCVVIIKHANPCGIAISGNIEDAYRKALDCDRISAYGGIVAINDSISAALANQISQMFYEIIIAPHFSEEALDILKQKKNLRLLVADFSNVSSPDLCFKGVNQGVLMQDQDKTKDVITEEISFALTCVKYLKSNAIAIIHDFQLIASGSGQTNRVDSMKIACEKLSKISKIDPARCIVASDAFLPFPDNLEVAAMYGIKTVVAPSGSIRDAEVKETAEKLGLNLIFTETRHFRH
jgi:phosphoribosylaminoimidazolecarboxamide formyltransferase/IMP cyclohydrolase